MGRVSDREKAELKARIRLSEVIGRTVTLLGRGPEYQALCPFHAENTPSFTVNDDKAFYHCFGCAAHGDIFDWLEFRHNLPFMEAVKQLANDAGLKLDNATIRPADSKAIERKRREQMAEAERKRKAAVGLWLYAQPMRGTPAEDYLRGRGIDFDKLGHYPGALRYRADCTHGALGEKLPAMLAIMLRRDEKVAVHRTFLEYRAGRWQKLDRIDKKKTAQFRERHPGSERIIKAKVKMVLGDAQGAYIPLWKGRHKCPLGKIPSGTPVEMSEGIEDGLSIPMLGAIDARVIAAYSLDNIGRVALPRQAGNLIIAAQNDPPTPADKQRGPREALEQAIARQQDMAEAWPDPDTGEIRNVQMRWPDQRFKDLNDQLTGKEREQ